MKDSDYITIFAPMVSKLNLNGNNLIVFALIHGFTKDGEHKFTGSIDYISKWTNISRQSVILTLKALTEAGFINKKEEVINGVKFCSYTTNYEDLISSQKSIPPIKKVKKGSQKSLVGGSQKSSPNNYNKDNYKYKDKRDEEIEPFAASPEAPTKTDKVPYKEIVDKYNNILGEKLPKVTALTDKRKKAINARVKEFGLESIDKVFNYAYNSPFLTGTNDKNWKCNFDWIFTPSNYVKILEGNYNNGEIPDAMNDKVKFNNFIEWVKKNAPRVLQMKVKLDEHGYKSIRNECGLNLMKENLIAMSNYENLLTEFKDPVLTCVKWKEYGTK